MIFKGFPGVVRIQGMKDGIRSVVTPKRKAAGSKPVRGARNRRDPLVPAVLIADFVKTAWTNGSFRGIFTPSVSGL